MPQKSTPRRERFLWGRWDLTEGADADFEDLALEVFFHDYCLIPENRLLSSGYLEGLETFLFNAEPSSSLVQATKLVAFANIGSRFGRPALVQRARIMYSDMLHTFQMLISNPASSSTAELLMTAVLLGLYEVRTKFSNI